MPAKKNTLIATILFIWACVLVYYNPRLFALLVGNEPIAAKVSVLIFIVTLDLMWLYGLYHLIHILFSNFRTKSKKSILTDSMEPVAIIYTTKNDFNETACLTCLQQDYTDYHLFICDDSYSLQHKKMVADFISQYPTKVTLIERERKTGFKAGNINNALSIIDQRYQYVLVSDADAELPSNFISKMMPCFKLNNRIAFVQARQQFGSLSESEFARKMDPLINLHFDHYAVNKNLYGHCMWYGHGAILRRDIIEELGGIPEVVTEDLAYSSEIRTLGYEGYFAEDVVSFEATPETALRFRIRNRKWVRGTFEYFMKYFPRLLKNKQISWFEKVDIFISAFSLLHAFPFMLFIFIASFIMPYHYSIEQMQGPLFLVPPVIYDNWHSIALKTRYNVFWSWDFYLIMMLTIFAPLFPVIKKIISGRFSLVRFLCVTTFMNLSLLLDSAKEILFYSITRKKYFPVTGDRAFNKNNIFSNLFEMILGACLSSYACKTYNMWLLALSIAILLTPINYYFSEKKLVKLLTTFPFIITTIVTILIGVTLTQQSLMN